MHHATPIDTGVQVLDLRLWGDIQHRTFSFDFAKSNLSLSNILEQHHMKNQKPRECGAFGLKLILSDVSFHPACVPNIVLQHLVRQVQTKVRSQAIPQRRIP